MSNQDIWKSETLKGTFPGVGDGDGVRVDVVLPLDEVLFPRDDRIGVTDELPLVPLVPLVELLGDVVFDMLRKAVVFLIHIHVYMKYHQQPCATLFTILNAKLYLRNHDDITVYYDCI